MRFVTELKIKMTSYNKLKIAILTIIASQNIHALHVEPVIIQSGTGDLLYAELNFNQANFNDQVKVSIATPEDLLTIGVKHQPSSYLNLYTRQGPNGTGVITITSSRPILDSELNVVVKIQEGNNTYLKHIKQSITSSNNNNKLVAQSRTANSNEKSLTPVMVVNEQDIALNLPESSTYQASQIKSMPNAPIAVEAPLVLNKIKPPELNSTIVVKATPTLAVPDLKQPEIAQTPIAPVEIKKTVEAAKPQITQANIPAPVQAIQQPMTVAKNAVKVSADPLVKTYTESAKVKQKSAKVSPTQTVTQSENAQHIVKNNESLWVIASRIATQENRSVNDVMHQIKANNQHAFIQGDINRLKRGATLNLQASAYSKDDKKVNQIAQSKTTNQKKQNKAKYRLNQAEMSLVAENSGHAASSENVNKNQTSNDLSSKVMTSRQKTVKLQKNVTQLDLALNQKDHRIHFLNARLAQLQQQLKSQQVVDKSNN